MAKRYTRINWQNKPNTATPISAENLNKMDKGIKDCDDAIGDLALLTTNNKTDLVSAINEQNNNLVNLLFNQLLESVSADYTDANDLPAGIVFSETKLINQPNSYCIIITLVTVASKAQIAISTRGDEAGNIYRRNCVSGTWTSWYKFIGTVV